MGTTTRVAAWYRRRSVDGALRRSLRRVARVVDRLETAPGGDWWDLQVNGERELLRRLAAATELTTIVDVGANTGEWYRAARAVAPGARIVCVEIAPPLWDGLAAQLQADPRAELARYGLGAHAGTTRLRFYDDQPALSTTLAFPHEARAREVDAEVRTVAQFLDEHDLDTIDVVKVDVEGAELPIVRGLEPLFRRGAVGVVQFEYGQANVLTRSLLRDYADIADRHGYRLGRVRPDGVELQPYRLADEDFSPRNMVLVRPDLVGAVGRVGSVTP